VKMLALNAILGRTVGFCLAAHAVLPRLPVMAAIHGKHSVEAGKSHYFAEIEAIRGFLDSEIHHGGGLFVLDEPFSGTNTAERIAIAHTVLRALGERSLVLVTTHDVELQAMLGERYALYHFQENPEVDGYFDYRLRNGAATERNAIR
ncbi:MutS-related protein, partial [Staphylococcus aureus]|uniref:MutS-related protein n=1 Tax=Staphylococcus aureus TaxID=1280 RepID=UPI0039BDB2C4